MITGFNKLQKLIFERDFNKWIRTQPGASVSWKYRRERAMAAYVGKNPNDFALLEKVQQQAFLDQLNNKGFTK
jgi:hypothetical protein